MHAHIVQDNANKYVLYSQRNLSTVSEPSEMK